MSNQNINIRRPYFKKNKYGQIIDNSFQQPGDVFVTSSVGDFYSNYLSLLLSMTPEQHALFYSGSLPFVKLDQTNLSSSEVERLRALVSESLENKELRNNNTPQEHPVIPNGSFIRTGGQVIDKDKVRLKNGIFYYIQEGKARRCRTPAVFLSLFQSITSLDPYKKEVLENNVPFDKGSWLNFFSKGKDITLEDLGAENYDSDSEDTTTTSSNCQKYSISTIISAYTFSYVDCRGTTQQTTVIPNSPITIDARPNSIKSIIGNGIIIPVTSVSTGNTSENNGNNGSSGNGESGQNGGNDGNNGSSENREIDISNRRNNNGSIQGITDPNTPPLVSQPPTWAPGLQPEPD